MWSNRDWECFPTALRFDLNWRLTEKGWKPDGWNNGRPVIPRVGPHAHETQWPLVDEVARALLDEMAAAIQPKPPPRKDVQPEAKPKPPKKKSTPKKSPVKATIKTTKRRATKKKE